MDLRLREVLVPSLKKFQLGESGDGPRLRAHARASGTAAYAAAIELFVKEEQTHARLLGDAIRALGGETLQRHWSHSWFARLRRLSGLRTELLVLMMAEIIGLRYFRALRDGIDNPVLYRLFAQIVADEEAHVDFHCDALCQMFAGQSWVMRGPARIAWNLFFDAVCTVMLLDHGEVLLAVGESRDDFRQRCKEMLAEMCRRIFSDPAAVHAKACASSH